MRQAVYTELIDRPAEAIWSYLADLRNDTAWRREITAVELVSGSPGTAPSAYRETVEWEGVHTQTILVLSEAVPYSRLLIQGDDPNFRSTSAWRFEPHEPGTLVSLRFSLEMHGPMQLVEPLMWNIVTNWLARDLPMLEGHLTCARCTQPA